MTEGYKQTEIGVLPEDWEVVSLKQVYDITSSKRVFQSEWKDSGVPFYRAREIAVMSEGKVAPRDLFISVEMYNAYVKQYGAISENDILITGVGTLGKVYVVKDTDQFYFKDGNIIWLQWNGKCCSNYIKHLYDTPLLQRQVHENAGGSTVGTYTITNAKDTLIPFPPLPEQRRIAEALSDVDELIASLEKLIAKKKAIKHGAMQELLTGKRRLPGFGEKWETYALGELGTFAKGKGISREESSTGTICAVRYGELYTKHQNYVKQYYSHISKEVASKALKVSYGDILFAASGETKEEIGKCAAIVDRNEIYAGGDIIVLRPNRPLDPIFIGALLNMPEAFAQRAEKGQGDAIVHIHADALSCISIIIPSFEEQSVIAETLFDADCEISALENKLLCIRQIKHGMMQQLLTGKSRLE